MARVKTFVNGGPLLPGDLNAIQDDYETAFSALKHLIAKAIILQAPAASGANPYLLVDGNSSSGVTPSGGTAGLAVFYLDPTAYAAGSRTTYYRIAASCVTNATAPAASFTVGMYPVTASGGANSSTVSLTLGTVVTGSTASFSTPPASSSSNQASTNFTAPAAGYYALGTTTSGSSAANSAIAISARLQVVQI